MSRSEIQEHPAPKGVIAIMTSPDGRVVASESDFDPSSAAGFQNWQRQRSRARAKANRATVDAYCSPVITEVLDQHDIDGICDDLCRKKGYRLTLKAIGYEGDIREEIER